ncbi:MAG: 4Fe-4S binding protein [Gammaproteobacteria bacterium]|nr:4Fe-4S binding protein [Gammaproteobacteria bacterium]
MQRSNYQLKNRIVRQWLLAPIVIITIGLGWKYYWIAFSVPIVMLINMLSPLLHRGRYVCGNFCPRGAFYDRVLRYFSRNKKVPGFLRGKRFRWTVFALISIFFIFQVVRSPELTPERFGHIFWLMCTATTVLGVLLSLLFNHRSWCAFCPIGTFVSAIGKDNHKLAIDKKLCVSCKLCERACPLNIQITAALEDESLSDTDCLKCRECIDVCPKKALRIK